MAVPAPHVARRRFLGALALAAAGAALALVLPRATDAAGDCALEDRDTRPHKGFASTREGSGGQCTTHAARRFDTVAPDPGVNWNGNARLWYDNAAAAGWVVGSTITAPLPGAIAVWDNWDGGSELRLFAGHVAFVERVTADGIEVSEMNWGGYLCSGWSRFRTSTWGRVSYASLTWEQAAQRNAHRFRGYVYPMREMPEA